MPPNKVRRHGLDAVFGGEVSHDRIDFGKHDVDSLHEGQAGPLWKAYIGGRVACHIHLVLYGLENYTPYNLCADFQVSPLRSKIEGHDVETGALQLSASNREVRRSNKDWVEHSVFVPVRKPLKDGKPMQFRIVRSLVGLRAFDDCPVRTRDFVVGVRAGELLAIRLDRECDLSGSLVGGGPPAVIEDELPGELIERTSEIVNDVPEYHGHTKPPFVGHCCDPKDVITRMRIELGAQSNLVAFSVEDRFNFAFKSVAMLMRPLNLGTGATKVDGHD
jgi:hypothetical protein